MATANIRHIINLFRKQIALVFLILIPMISVQAQLKPKKKSDRINNPNYDKRFVSYGFLLGLHTTNYKLEYSDAFATENSALSEIYPFDSIHSVVPRWSTGFTLGFIVNFKFFDLLDGRLTPQVSFYEQRLDYRFITGDTDEQVLESTLVEFPILAKYKSERRGNIRMYVIGGLKPGIEVAGKNKIESGDEVLDIREANLTFEAGFGFDVYFPLFKFSPEIRYSRGLTNLHRDVESYQSASLRELNTNSITLYLLFQ